MSNLDSSAHGLLTSDEDSAEESDFNLQDALDELDTTSPMHGNGAGKQILSNDIRVAITRPPTTGRDVSYAAAFWLHFVVIILLSFAEGRAMKDSLIVYGKAGSWASFFMIVTVLGAFCGCGTIFVLANYQRRDQILSATIPASIIMQLVFGSVLLALRTRYSFLGIIFFLSVLVDSFKYERARESIGFTSAVLNIVIKILNQYGTSMVATCVCLVVIQTLIILWWGSFFVGLIASVHEAYADILVAIMLISLYWIQQVFQSLICYIVGGCTLWYFHKQADQSLRAQERVLLHLQCGLTVAFGSVCKGALYSNFAMYILELRDWSLRISEGNGCICGVFGISSVINSARRVVGYLIVPFVNKARAYHRLAFCVAATYGRTFSRSASDHCAKHQETIDIAIDDTTTHVLSAMTKLLPSCLATCFGMFVELDSNHDEGRSWSLFFLVCFSLSYCGFSLALSVYKASTDALIVAFAETPEKLAAEDQIIFSRFLRCVA